MLGCRRTASTSVRSTSLPVRSAVWMMRRRECPPSRPSDSAPSGSWLNRAPNSINSRMRAGPSVTSTRTASSLHSPAPAMSVS